MTWPRNQRALKHTPSAGSSPVAEQAWLAAGKKKLLRKAEFRNLGTHVNTLHTLGDRIYVGDLQAGPYPAAVLLLGSASAQP